METQEILGLQWMKHDTFLHYTKDSLFIWSLNRYHIPFTYATSEIVQISRVDVKGVPGRILVMSSDGNIRLVSPVTGLTLVTSFPILRESQCRTAEYDIVSGKRRITYIDIEYLSF